MPEGPIPRRRSRSLEHPGRRLALLACLALASTAQSGIAWGGQFPAILQLSSLNGVTGFRIDGTTPGDRSGMSVNAAGDVNGDGFGDIVIGAPNAEGKSGATYVVFGKAGGFGRVLDLEGLDGSNGFRLKGVGLDDRNGWWVAAAGDVNGDGFADIVTGSALADPAHLDNAGEAYVVFGKAAGFTPELDLSSLDGANGFRIRGEAANASTGFAVGSAGDVNGDGLADVLVGAHGADPGGRIDAGKAYVVFGRTAPFAAAVDLSRLDGTNGFAINGMASGDLSGLRLDSAGDVNGDGLGDILIGAPAADPRGIANAGESYVVFGRSTAFPAALDLSALDGSNGFRLQGTAAGDSSGRAVARAGDVNGDGIGDIVVGAFAADPGGYNQAGQSYVVFGRTTGFAPAIRLDSLDGADGFRIDGIDDDDLSGFAVASAGDVNGDGFADIMIGAYGWAPDNALFVGESYVVFGKAGGFPPALALADLDGTTGFRLRGTGFSDKSGYAVASAGDLNGDGFADMLVGANGGDGGGADSGSSYVVFGHANGPLDRTGTADRDILSGGEWNDIFRGMGGNDWIRSGAGDDQIDGGDGSDTIAAGPGKDVIYVSAGADSIDGGDQRDQLRFTGLGSAPVTINLALGSFRHPGGAVQKFESIEMVLGGGGPDTIIGNDADNVLSGAGGNDTINGADGDDNLIGQNGQDRLIGGPGSDRFTYAVAGHSAPDPARRDSIADFTVAPGPAVVDRIDLSAIDAKAATPGDDAFSFIGDRPFTAEGQLRAVQVGSNTLVEANIVGPDAPELAILLSGVSAAALGLEDFVP